MVVKFKAACNYEDPSRGMSRGVAVQRKVEGWWVGAWLIFFNLMDSHKLGTSIISYFYVQKIYLLGEVRINCRALL